MIIEATEIKGAYLITLDCFPDDRGNFFEAYQGQKYEAMGLNCYFCQDNVSSSKKNVLRGLHYQVKRPMGHLVTVVRGAIFDVGVDLRRDSETFGKSQGYTIRAEFPQQLYLPPGVAHGFCALEADNLVLYKCTGFYEETDESGVLWNDPQLAIPWPVTNPIISSRDSRYPVLSEINDSRFPIVDI